MNAEVVSTKPLDVRGLHSSFLVLYTIGAFSSIALYATVILLANMDLILTGLYAFIQARKTASNKGLIFLKDTQEWRAMQYITKSATEDEPYHIFLEQSIVSLDFTILQMMMFLVALHVGIYIVVLVVAMITKRSVFGNFPRPYKTFAIILAVSAFMLVMFIMYNNMFVKSARPKLAESRGRLRDIKKYIYNHLTTNEDFLRALRTNNEEAQLDIIKGPLKRYRNRSTADIDLELRKMVFTKNLYEYFKTQIPDSDMAWESIRNFFTSSEIESQQFDPTAYFYFGPPLSIPNTYTAIADIKDPSDTTDNSIQELLGTREKAFRSELDMIMRELNKRLSYLKYQTKGNKQVCTYVWTIAAIVWIALLCTYFVLPDWMRQRIRGAIGASFQRLKDFFRLLWQGVKTKLSGL